MTSRMPNIVAVVKDLSGDLEQAYPFWIGGAVGIAIQRHSEVAPETPRGASQNIGIALPFFFPFVLY